MADRPPHRSVRAELPHTALALDVDSQTAHGDQDASYPSVPLLVYRAIHATCVLAISWHRSGSMSGAVAIAQDSPWSAPFPPPAPLVTARHLGSPVSQVRWNGLTPRQRACRGCGFAPFPTDPFPWQKRMLPRSHGFREKGFQPGRWSRTPWGSRRTCLERLS